MEENKEKFSAIHLYKRCSNVVGSCRIITIQDQMDKAVEEGYLTYAEAMKPEAAPAVVETPVVTEEVAPPAVVETPVVEEDSAPVESSVNDEAQKIIESNKAKSPKKAPKKK